MKDKPLVLIIEDSPINLKLLYHLLKAQYFCVVLANRGEQGLALAKQSPPDIILLDVDMPGWNGYETCQRIKLKVFLANIPNPVFVGIQRY